jgi:hypothetical protein
VNGSDVKYLLWLRDQLPDMVADLMVVTTGTTAYRRSDGVVVVQFALLGRSEMRRRGRSSRYS